MYNIILNKSVIFIPQSEFYPFLASPNKSKMQFY